MQKYLNFYVFYYLELNNKNLVTGVENVNCKNCKM